MRVMCVIGALALAACGEGEPTAQPAAAQPAAAQPAAAQPAAAQPAAAQPAAAQPAAASGDAARAQAALAPLKSGLKAALMGAIQAKGPAGAVEACKLEAPRVTSAAEVGGIRVGRASDKLRNPGNAPPEWVKPHLQAWLAAAPASGAHITQPLLDGRVGYAEPILVQPPCLLCHGVEVAPPVRERLSALYPADQATGYALGQVRGVFWVDLPAAR